MLWYIRDAVHPKKKKKYKAVKTCVQAMNIVHKGASKGMDMIEV